MSNEGNRDFARLTGRLEQKVGSAHWAEATEVLAELIMLPEVVAPAGIPGTPPAELQAVCTRFANAWGRLFSTEGWQLDGRHLVKVLPRLHRVHAIVHGSALGSLDKWLLRLHQARAGKYDAQAIARLALLWVPNSTSSFAPFAYLAHSRHVVAAQLLATIGGITLCTPQADRARRVAIDLFLSGQVTVEDLRPFAGTDIFLGAWMRCSYATHPGRHKVKALLNQSMRDMVGSRIPDATAAVLGEALSHRVDGKPVMAVPLEMAWERNGAMRRCYGEVMKALRHSFHTVAFGGPAGLDADGIFDRQILRANKHPGVEDIIAMAGVVRDLKPSVLFYPSIGMDIGAIILSNFRLAPLQVMALGHPATSCSSAIDCVIHEVGYVGNKACYTERVIEVPAGSIRFSRPIADGLGALRDHDSGVFRIAVPAVAQKISWPLLDVLRRLQQRVPVKCEFRFFSGLSGISLLEASTQISAALPQATVFPMLGYGVYMDRLAECDIHLASFPFGGTNSVIDAFHLGVPVLSLRGPEPHESVDAELVTRAGLADALVARDVDDLLDKLTRFATDVDWRVEVSARMRAAIASGDFLGGGDPGVYCERFAALLAQTPGATTGS
jgi:hypothetical protein